MSFYKKIKHFKIANKKQDVSSVKAATPTNTVKMTKIGTCKVFLMLTMHFLSKMNCVRELV